METKKKRGDTKKIINYLGRLANAFGKAKKNPENSSMQRRGDEN